MSPNMIPFNLSLLVLTQADLTRLGHVEVQDIHEGMTRNFHPKGLFSTEIFGKAGDSQRSARFGYIALNTEIFHPVIYKAICDLKELYGDILASRAYAVWDAEKCDFFKSDIVNGETGFQFFVKHWRELKPEVRRSDRREAYLRLVDEYRDKSMISHLVVLPAGLRDYEVDINGRPSENEINPLYRRVLSTAAIMHNSRLAAAQQDAIDRGRYAMQSTVWEIYEHFRGILDGKTGLMLSKFASRKVSDSTRSIITAARIQIPSLRDPRLQGPNDSLLGMHMYIRNIAPLAIFHLKDRVLNERLGSPSSPAVLVHPKTRKRTLVTLSNKDYDKWMTYDGIESVFMRFGEETLRHEPVMINGHYLSLTYIGSDDTVRLVSDIDDVPEERRKDDIHPTTIAELLYYAILPTINRIPNFNTRYPVSGFGSNYPAWCMVRTTLPARRLSVLNDQWTRTTDDLVALDWPIIGNNFFNALSIAPQHLARAAGDHDGDMLNSVAAMSDEGIGDVKRIFDSASYYVGPNGSLNFATANDTLTLVVKYLTAPAVPE